MVTIRLRLTVKTIITLVYPCKYTMTLLMFKVFICYKLREEFISTRCTSLVWIVVCQHFNQLDMRKNEKKRLFLMLINNNTVFMIIFNSWNLFFLKAFESGKRICLGLGSYMEYLAYHDNTFIWRAVL